MNAIENKSLFSDISAEDSSMLNGGLRVACRTVIRFRTRINPFTGRVELVRVPVRECFFV